MQLIGKSQSLFLFAAIHFAATCNAQDTDAIGEPAPAPPPEQVPVAEEQLPPAEDETPPTLTDEEELAQVFERYKQLLRDGVLDEADTAGKRVVELAIRIYGPRSNDAAKALTNLAIVQHRNEQFDLAEQNFATAIDIIEDNEDRLNGQLVNPLRGLGAAQLESGRPDLAAQTFSRAVHVTHVNEGPHNLEQIDLLESLAEANLRLGLRDEAKDVHDTIHALNLRFYADNRIEMVPALMRRAAWQHRAGFIYDERTTYRRVIKIIEDAGGDDDLRLIEPLTRLGRSFFFVDLSGTQSYRPTTMTTGEIYFKRAVRIAEDNPESDWKTLAGTTLALGDYYMFQGNEQRARKVYADAWELLSKDEARHDFRHDALEQLVTLRQRELPQYAGEKISSGSAEAASDVMQGRITLTYVVSPRGRATNLKVVEAQPPEFSSLLQAVQREMRRRVYRPHFEDGQPVASPEQVLTHRFYYRQSDLDALRDDAQTETVTEAT